METTKYCPNARLNTQNGWVTADFAGQKDKANQAFLSAVKIYYANQGVTWREPGEWGRQREESIKKSEVDRKKQWQQICDKEILDRLQELYFDRGGSEELKISPSVYAVLKVIIGLVSESSVLYASAATIASRAHVCRDTVTKVTKTLEFYGILRRQQSGGMICDPKSPNYGQTITNVYHVSHQELRKAIGVECKYKSRYEIPEPSKNKSTMSSLKSLVVHARLQQSVLKNGGRGASWHPFRNGYGYARKVPKNECGKPYYRPLIQVYKCAVPSLVSALQLVRASKDHQQVSLPSLLDTKTTQNYNIFENNSVPKGTFSNQASPESLFASLPVFQVRPHIQTSLSELPTDLQTRIITKAEEIYSSNKAKPELKESVANSYISQMILRYEINHPKKENQ